MPLQVTIVLKGNGDSVGDKATVVARDHTFKSGTQGYYFRDRVVLNGESHHVQLIVSKK